jgi:Helix-turn-helix domain
MRDPSEHAKFVWNTMKRANSDQRLTSAACRVLFWLIDHLDQGDDAHVAYPSIAWLCWLTGQSHDTIERAVNALEKYGYIDVLREHRKNHRYTVLEQPPFNRRAIRQGYLDAKAKERLNTQNPLQEMKRYGDVIGLDPQNPLHRHAKSATIHLNLNPPESIACCAEAQRAQTRQARNGTEANPSQRKPSGGQANGSAEGSKPFALPRPALPSEGSIVLPAAAEPPRERASHPAEGNDTPSNEKPLHGARSGEPSEDWLPKRCPTSADRQKLMDDCNKGLIPEAEYWRRIKILDAEYQRRQVAEPAAPPNRRTTKQAVENMLLEMLHDISGNRNKAQDTGNQRAVNKWRQYQNEALAVRDLLATGQIDARGALSELSKIYQNLPHEPAGAKPLQKAETANRTATVITMAAPPIVPKPPTPSTARKPKKLTREQRQQLVDAQQPIHLAHASGAIGEAEYLRLLTEIEAEPREACGAA